MSEPKFTRGPWVATKDADIECRNGLIVANVTWRGGRGDRPAIDEETIANAILIKSSPDMYAALDELITLKDDVKLRDPAEYERRKEAAWAAAKAAIAKARGGDR